MTMTNKMPEPWDKKLLILEHQSFYLRKMLNMNGELNQWPENIVAERHEITEKWVIWYATDAQVKVMHEALNNSTRWQPIETAPKDGTEFLGYFGSYGVKQIHWNELPNINGKMMSDWYEKGLRFFPHAKPTHWMPLLEPPEEVKEIIE